MLDESRVAFTSKRRYERIAEKSGAAFTAPAFGITVVAIDHNLGYKPYFKGWYTFGGKMFPLFAGTASFNLDGNGAQIEDVVLTNTQILVTISSNTAAAVSGTLYYRVYAEPQA